MSNKNTFSYPQPDAPKSTKSPLETLSPNPNFQRSLGSQYGYSVGGAIIGFTTIFLSNYYSKRPFFSGFYQYPIAMTVGAAAVYALQKYKENQWAERDAVLRHYISLHPEDFPAYERVKLGDVFEKWVPVR